jgi:hypothetical protein
VGEHPHAKVRLEVGGGLRRFFDMSLYGGDLRFGVGSQRREIGHYFEFSLFYGDTEYGLRAYDVFLGYGFDAKIDIVHLGLGVEGGYLFIRRASLDDRMWALGIGAHLHAGIDLIKLGHDGEDALYLDLRLSGSLHMGGGALWGPSALVGFRF